MMTAVQRRSRVCACARPVCAVQFYHTASAKSDTHTTPAPLSRMRIRLSQRIGSALAVRWIDLLLDSG
jgi:hypothetical protein